MDIFAKSRKREATLQKLETRSTEKQLKFWENRKRSGNERWVWERVAETGQQLVKDEVDLNLSGEGSRERTYLGDIYVEKWKGIK